jgi:hypothetical protein
MRGGSAIVRGLRKNSLGFPAASGGSAAKLMQEIVWKLAAVYAKIGRARGPQRQ